MAETVKQSRIVSDDDDNLEETLLEEFNMRLKNCMSKDNLQNPDEHEEENSLYENIGANARPIHKSGVASNNFIQNERESYYDEPAPLRNGSNPSQNGHVTYDEPENIYETLPEHHEIEKTDSDQYVDMSSPDKATKNNLKLDVSPAIEIETATYEEFEIVNKDPDDSSLLENSYEIIEEKPKFTMKTTDFSENRSPENEAKSSVKDRMFLATDEATLLFTQTVTSPMLTPSEENIDFLKGFQRENTASDNTISTSNESPEKDDLDKAANEENNTSEISGEISASEQLTNDIAEDKTSENQENIYENAEFLKQTSENIYENLKEKPKAEEENIYENLKDLKKDVEDEQHEENIYQDIEECKKVEEIYENVEEVKNKEASWEEMEPEQIVSDAVEEPQVTSDEIVTDLDEVESQQTKEDSPHEEVRETTERLVESHTEHYESKESTVTSNETVKREESEVRTEGQTESYSEFVHHSKSESNYYEKYTEVVSQNSKNVEISNREKDTETVPAEIVKNLKSQFLKTGAEVVATTKKEVEDVNQLKTVNIIKQINKFESGDSPSMDLDDSTVTHYTETRTFQTDGIEEKAIKKKKTKKSRKEEKENISVNDVDNVDGKNFYNVNVKSLCRSFGDLTKIDDDKYPKKQSKKAARTKSLSDDLLSPNNPTIENVFSDVSVRALKSSFNKFDALQKKNVLHVRSSDSEKAQEKFNGTQQIDTTNCRACAKQVFQMEQIKAEKSLWHKNCFRCTECSKQLTVETYASHEGNLYCKPHFKSLFAPKVVEDEAPPRPRKAEPIIRENQPLELPPDVVRASDKPDLGLEELQSLNVKERFQVFEHHQTETQESDRGPTPVNVKKSPSILSKLARFQAKGMDVGVSDEALNGIPIEETSSEEEEEEEVPEGEDATLYRAKKVQKEKPFHFTNLSEVKNKWEHGEQTGRDERREERKQEIQTIRNRLFMGKQGKMKEAYQQAIIQSESSANLNKPEKIESCDTKSLKERFEKGELFNERETKTGEEEEEVYQSEISKKSRSLFLELDANASKPPQISPVIPQKLDVKKAREAYLAKTSSEDTVKSSEVMEDVVEVKTADIQERFKFFETYKEPEKQRKQFRITPPRDPSQVKTETPEREIYHDPEVVRADDVYVDDSVIAKSTHTASKMLNKFRQMEENLSREPEPAGPKPLKRFTPPPEPVRQESSSEEESGSEEESEEDQVDNQRLPEDLLEAQKAARAKQLKAKFEKWEAQEIRREQTNTVNIVEEYGDESQVETARSLRARFESMRDSSSDKTRTPRVKVNRFVEIPCVTETCQSCNGKVYPLEKISVHGHIYHKNCFKCKECSCVLRMDSYSYNQGLLYCTPHFKRLFITKGNYDTAFGLDQHKEKWNVNATMA
ncbi:xin actin-binding repeat-containing protein 2 isoform X3 [Anoplophora glabripennis]|uniref:xin actin-binding repeat-containing protein 2 isoform X3 n=1 Tax=Anoplophora glabripennis TaxID=217634 RepID=UPI000873FA86|nr:xin actin-binding repeat-containing protein 2 isoform X3 [Anoplophora glabripennis]